MLFSKYSYTNTIYKLAIIIMLLFTVYFNIVLDSLFFFLFLASYRSLISLLVVLKHSHNFSLSSISFLTRFCCFSALFFSATSCRFLFLYSTFSLTSFCSWSLKESISTGFCSKANDSFLS